MQPARTTTIQQQLFPAADTYTLYEQPLNERMRTFLRLDYLYNQALYHNEKASQWGSRAAVASLIDILAITTRSDVRSEVLKEIERHLAQLRPVGGLPWVGRRSRLCRRPCTCRATTHLVQQTTQLYEVPFVDVNRPAACTARVFAFTADAAKIQHVPQRQDRRTALRIRGDRAMGPLSGAIRYLCHPLIITRLSRRRNHRRARVAPAATARVPAPSAPAPAAAPTATSARPRSG